MEHILRMMVLSEQYKYKFSEVLCKVVESNDEHAIVATAKLYCHWTMSSEYWLNRYVEEQS
jgi:hypothetical protein